MKILYHHRIRSKDGQYVHIEELTNALRNDGHELVFVGPGSIDNEEFGADAGMVAWMKSHLPGFVYEFMELSYSILDFLRLARAIWSYRPDCIYERYNLFLPSGIWAKKVFGLPLLLEVNAPLYAERRKYDGISLDWLARSVERYTWRGADFALPVTEVLAETLREAGVHAEKIRVIPNGINTERFGKVPLRDDAKSRLGLDGKFVLGFAGFVREWHGLERVLEYIASAGDQNLHLLLVGDGPARAFLLDKANELGVANQFTITGVIDRENVAAYLAAFDIALQPKVVDYASPLKLFEYLMLSHAIVAPATPNIMEILEDGRNALLFDPESDEEFCDRIKRIHDDRELAERLGANARATIRDLGLTWKHNAERVYQLFKDLGVVDAGATPANTRPK